MGEVIHIERVPRRMECGECECAEFVLYENGLIRCSECDGLINAVWAKSNLQPTASDPAVGE